MSLLKTLLTPKRKTASPRGRLIAIDGLPGSGKTTHANLLAQALSDAGYPAEVMSFPRTEGDTSTFISKLGAGEYAHSTVEARAIVYALDRFDAAASIRTKLEQGILLITDTYTMNSAGMEGGKLPDHIDRIKFFRWLDNLEYSIFKIPKPDTTFVLNLPPDIAHMLQTSENKKTKGKNAHAAVTELGAAQIAFLEAAKLYPNTKIIQCIQNGKLQDQTAIQNQIWELVRRIVLKDYLPPL